MSSTEMADHALPIPSTMPAWLKRRGTFVPVYAQVPVPACPADGFLVRVLAAGICHSDVGLIEYDSVSPYYRDEYVLGHEGAGVIVAKGEAVPAPFASELHIGDLVAIHPTAGCGRCLDCDAGLPQHCTQCTCHGLGRDGSFTWYVAVDARTVVKVPPGVSVEQAAIATDAVMTAYHAVVRRAEVERGASVFVFGVGGLGCNAVQILLHLGCHVFVADTRAEPLAYVTTLGIAQEDIVPLGDDVRTWVKARALRIDVVLDFAGVEQTMNDAIAIGELGGRGDWADQVGKMLIIEVVVRNGGKIIPVGLLAREIKIDYLFCVLKRISMLYIYGGLREDLQDGMDLIAKGVVTPRIETAPMPTFPDALQRLHEGKIKGRIVLIPENIEGTS